MGKHSGTELPGAHALDEACNAVHNARDELASLGSRLVTAGHEGIAGRLFVLAERMKLAALTMRVDFTGQDAPAPHNVPPVEKPKRVRGPRKPRATAAERTESLPSVGLSSSEMARARNGGAS